MHMGMVARRWKNTRYKYLVCPMGLYHSLKDSLCCSEWSDVCFKWLFENVQCLFHLYGRHSKILEKGDFNKYALSLVLSTLAYKQSFLA